MRLFALVTFVSTVALLAILIDATSGNEPSDDDKRSLADLLRPDSLSEPRPRVKRSPSRDRTQQTNGLGKANDNKVSAALHFVHRKSHESLFKRPSGLSAKSSPHAFEPDYSKMPDKELLESLCEGRPLVGMCKGLTGMAARHNPENVAKIAQAIREKPANVDAIQLRNHLALETGIRKIEEKGLDKKLDFAIDLTVKRNPYAYGAVKAFDVGRKLTRQMSF